MTLHSSCIGSAKAGFGEVLSCKTTPLIRVEIRFLGVGPYFLGEKKRSLTLRRDSVIAPTPERIGQSSRS